MKSRAVHSWRNRIIPATLVLLMAGLAEAQASGTGAIAGRVSDPSGAVISHAHVSVVSEETNWSRAMMTTAEGLFRAELLAPGNYSLEVEAQGFRAKTLRSIHVVIAETARVDLKLGSARQRNNQMEDAYRFEF